MLTAERITKPSANRREALEYVLRATADQARRQARKEQSNPHGGLLAFVRHFWRVLEPERELVEGWPLEALCRHLEAVTRGDVKKLLANVPPGFCKSLLVNVFWPAWEWGPAGLPHLRHLSFSYAAHLTERDNRRFLTLLLSKPYQELWGDKFKLIKVGETLVSNDKMGWKLATSFGGVATGERADRVVLDDPHSVKEAESEVVRTNTVTWFRESMANRLNDLRESAVVVIMQRVHEGDVSGEILEAGLPYVHLMIPMEYDGSRHCSTEIGWSDPREDDGELAWPERFPSEELDQFRSRPFMWAGQYQQTPEPRGGAIFKRDDWQTWESKDGKFPQFDFLVASLDTAYETKQENDYSALTIWGTFRDIMDQPCIMLVSAWRERLELNPLVVKVAASCKRFKVDRLLIEAKASGHSVAQEIRRLHGREDWAVHIVNPQGDKVARAHAVQHLFAQGLIFAPDRDWADMVISEMAMFPKGTHDDLVDSSTQALKHLRDLGLAVRREEVKAERDDEARYRRPMPALYPT